MVAKILGAQRDFSAGEIDVTFKRNDDHPARKAGVRQLANWRILNSQGAQNRPGRRALFPSPNGDTRIEEILMSPGNVFKIAFGNGRFDIINSAGSIVFSQTFRSGGAGAPLPWTLATLVQIDYAVLGLSIYVTFPGMRPQIISWDGVSVWSSADFIEQRIGSQIRGLFYRISPQGVTLLPGAASGVGVGLTASAPIFTPAWIGVNLRYIGRQMRITGFSSSTHVFVSIEENLPGSQSIGFGSSPANVFNIGDEVIGSVSGAKGIVVSIASAAITVQLLSTETTNVTTTTGGINTAIGVIGGTTTTTTFAFLPTDIVAGPGGSLPATAVGALGVPQAVTDWDDEVMNDFRGYPASVFVDQFRLGFCNFPSVPGGIAWSAINNPIDLYVGPNPDDAIFEIAPDKVQVLAVVPGPESSEFVFCDKRIYYIPISTSSPLAPGSVSFQLLSGDGAAQVKPRVAQEIILYVGAGGNSVMAVIATGAYLRPFNTRYISQFHNHLFSSGIVALAAQTADATFTERYVYALCANGSVVAGKYTGKGIESESIVGWGPWSGVGTVNWVSALASDIIFTSSYFGVGICEILDDTQYLDGALPVNSLPAAFTPPGGKGPLWFIPSQTVTLMDQGTRMMGTYQIDANGNIVPQNNGGENLLAATLVAGQPWTATLEPFVTDAQPGTDAGQRMFKRRVARLAVYVVNSTGFLMVRLFSGPITRTSPALGTVMNQYRVTAWNQDDDPTKPPPLREEAQRSRPIGRSFDPRVAIIKDTPGPLLIAEIGMESTI